MKSSHTRGSDSGFRNAGGVWRCHAALAQRSRREWASGVRAESICVERWQYTLLPRITVWWDASLANYVPHQGGRGGGGGGSKDGYIGGGGGKSRVKPCE